MKVVCAGNSIVNGFPHRRSCSFPSVLRELTGWKVINKGINGETTAMLAERFDKDVISHAPEKVIILTGTNDFIFKTETPEGAMKNIADLAEKAKEKGVEVVLLTPISCDETQAAECWMKGSGTDYNEVNGKLSELAEMIREYGSMNSCKVVDLEVEYKKFAEFHDGIHPTVEGHAYIAKKVKEGI